MNQVVIIFALLSFVDCTFLVKREEDNVIGVKNITDGSLTLKWNLFNFVGIDDYIILLYYNTEESKNRFAQESVSATSNKVINARPITKIEDVPFKDRLKGSINITNGNGTCIIQISNLQFDDEGVIILIAYVSGPGASETVRDNITFSVKGGPYTCQESNIPQNLTCEAGNQIKGKITLCGKPQPHVTWFIGDKAFNGSVDESMKSQHQYIYIFNEKVTSDMCGKDISYVANGYTGTKKEIVSKVLLKKFNISNAEFKQTKEGCPILTWEAEGHGSCEVDMFVSFLQNDNSTMNITIPVKNQKYQDCSRTLNSTAVYYKTIVYMINENGNRVQISKDDDHINKTMLHYVKLQTTTTTTPTTTTLTTTIPTTTTARPQITYIANTTGKLNCSEFGLKMIGVLIGGIFIGLMLACFGFVVYTKRINRKIDEKRKERKSETVIQPIEENYSSLMTSFSNGKSIYADLQHTQKNVSNYEIMDTHSKNTVNYEVV